MIGRAGILEGLLPTIVTRADVPDDIESVLTIRPGAEVGPRDVGVNAEELRRAWAGFERVYRSGIHPAMQVCIRCRGEVLIDRALGYASGAGPGDGPDEPRVVCTPDTPFNLFSASKAVTAMVIHLLDQRHLIHLDDPVCEYIPEFGVHGKQWITIRHVLTHRAGIPNLSADALDLDLLAEPERIVEILCDAHLLWRPGRQLAYHAISGGFLLGEIVRRVTGLDIRAFHEREIVRPLGFRWMNYGVAPEDFDMLARNYFTGPPVLPPASLLLRRALGVDFYRVSDMSNDPRFLTAVMPAANLFATAEELSRYYQMLLEGGAIGGVRIFDPRTIRRATSEQSYFELDLTLGVPLRYGMGFMLGGRWLSLYGQDTSYAFGHLGLSNIVSWADPERQIAAAVTTSGKPFLYPEIVFLLDAVRRVTLACPKVAPSDRVFDLRPPILERRSSIPL
jgi:CubicO group peptidase (beta-lactamase class C family)